MKQKMQFAARLAMVLTAVVWLSACKDGVKLRGLGASGNIEFEQIESHLSNEQCQADVFADYPFGGSNEVLVEAVREWIKGQLNDSYTGDLNDGQALLDYSVKAFVEETTMDESDWAVITEGLWGAEIKSTRSDSIYVRYECDAYITLMNASTSYGAGAAHGMYGYFGVTLRKSDGEQITWDMFKETDSRLFQALLENGLREYFEIDDSEDLNEYLLLEFYGESDDIPLPKNPPVLTADGVEFIYQPYEIASFAAGILTFVVSYEHIKPFMKTSLRKLIEGEK